LASPAHFREAAWAGVGYEGDHVVQPIDRKLRGLQQAGQRLENASKEWAAAYRLYAAALTELDRKQTPPEKRPQPAAKYPGSGH
jgi:hypothetical protein